MEKITLNGIVMWKSVDGEITKNPNEPQNKYGWHKITVDGKVMWESPNGERSLTRD